MGSFNVGCGISNIAIHDRDKVGIVLLKKDTSDYRMNETQYVYATDRYSPYLPPVYGEYGDYGRAENFIPNRTTEVIKAIFGIPIESVSDCIGNNDRSIYYQESAYIQHFGGDSLKSPIYKSYSASMEEKLEILGFTRTDSLSYEYDGGKYTLTRADENSWSVIETGKGTLKAGIHARSGGDVDDLLVAFGRATGIYPGYPQDKLKIISELRSLNIMFFNQEVFEKMRVNPDELESWEANHYTRQVEELTEYLAPPETVLPFSKYDSMNKWEASDDYNEDDLGNAINHYYGYRKTPYIFDHHCSLSPEFYPMLSKYEGDPAELLSLSSLTEVMTMVNRPYNLTFCGTQDGDDRASLKLNEVTSEILRRNLSEYEEYDEDEED